jgi:hypothetical protein
VLVDHGDDISNPRGRHGRCTRGGGGGRGKH